MEFLKRHGVVIGGFLAVCLVVFGFLFSLVNLGITDQKESREDLVRLVTDGSMIKGSIVKFEPYSFDATGRSSVKGREGIYVTIEYDTGPEGQKKVYEDWKRSQEFENKYGRGSEIELYYLESNKKIKAASRHDRYLQNALLTVINSARSKRE